MQTILAIDNSTNKCGYSIWEDGKLSESGHFCVSSDHLMGSMFLMREWVWKKLEEWDFDIMVSEDPMSLARVNPKVCKKLCMTLAILIEMCRVHKIQWEELSPSEIKKVMTGKGNANKDMVRESVKEKLGVDTDSEDEADAIAIGYTLLSKIIE